jgi:hypothetical protein
LDQSVFELALLAPALLDFVVLPTGLDGRPVIYCRESRFVGLKAGQGRNDYGVSLDA